MDYKICLKRATAASNVEDTSMDYLLNHHFPEEGNFWKKLNYAGSGSRTGKAKWHRLQAFGAKPNQATEVTYSQHIRLPVAHWQGMQAARIFCLADVTMARPTRCSGSPV